MQHRGEIIKEAIYRSGYPVTELAKRLGKSRRWMYLTQLAGINPSSI